jgi:hypothetical protein
VISSLVRKAVCIIVNIIIKNKREAVNKPIYIGIDTKEIEFKKDAR